MIKTAATSVLALLAALFLTGILIALCGYDPFDVYQKVFLDTLSNTSSLILCLSQSTPLIFAGLAFTVGFRVGTVNTGVEGQLIAGGFAAACVGAYIQFLPGKTHLIVSLLAGAAAGGLIAFLTILIKLKTGAPEVITCIMFNKIIDLVTQYLANGPLKPPTRPPGRRRKFWKRRT